MELKPRESESDLQEAPFAAVALVVEAGEVVLAKSSHFLVPPLFDDTVRLNGTDHQWVKSHPDRSR